LIGCLVGLTTVLFGFGGGFVTVPIITLVDADLGHDTARVAAATSALVMLVNAIVATVSTRRETLAHLKGRWWLLGLLGLGGALGAFAGRFAPEALLQWGFVAYIAATAIDLLVRPGFFRRKPAVVHEVGEASEGGRGISAAWGVPIGGLASFLGVGGAVMTVAMLRRSGATMTVATTLANPLTLVIMSPAVLVTVLTRPRSRLPESSAHSTCSPPRPCSSAGCRSSCSCAAGFRRSPRSSMLGGTSSCSSLPESSSPWPEVLT